MDSPSISIAPLVRSELINLDGVAKFSPNRRFATVYSEGSPLDSLFFLESGFVKILKRGDDNKEIILQIVSPGRAIRRTGAGHGSRSEHGRRGIAGGRDLRHPARFICARLATTILSCGVKFPAC